MHSSPREVSSVTFQFNTVRPVQLSCGVMTGCAVSGSSLTFNVSSLFGAWYASNTDYGSLATLRVPFSIQGNISGSISVLLNNSLGASNSMSIPIP
jgi:hypothetical protein